MTNTFFRRERMNSDFITCPSCLPVAMNWTLITNCCFLPHRRDSGTNSAAKNTLNLPLGAKLQDRWSAWLHFSWPPAAQSEDNVSLYGCSQIKRADGQQILFNYLAFYNSKLLFCLLPFQFPSWVYKLHREWALPRCHCPVVPPFFPFPVSGGRRAPISSTWLYEP